MTACDRLLEAGCSKAIEWRNWAPVHSTMMKNFGAQYIDENGYFAFDTPEAEACYNWYKGFISKYAITGEGSIFGSYSINTANAPRAAMVVDTYANLSYYTGRAEKNDWICDAASFPNYVQLDENGKKIGDGYVGAGCSGYAITTSCTDEQKLKWAWEFLRYCLSEEGYDEVASLGRRMPRVGIYEIFGRVDELREQRLRRQFRRVCR